MSRVALFFVTIAFVSSLAFGLPSLERPDEVALDPLYDTFIAYVKEFGKNYTNFEDFSKRFKIFKAALPKIDALNKAAQEAAGKNSEDDDDDDDDDDDEEYETALFGCTNYTDWTEEEWGSFCNASVPESIKALPEVDFGANENLQAPKRIDWRKRKVVNPIKNQGSCGSCWAFATVAMIESRHAMQHKKDLKTLSEQQLLDCDRNSNGCNGGWMDSAIQSCIDQGGVEAAKTYPYEGRQGSCRALKSDMVVKVKDNLRVKGHDENALCNYISKSGPIVNAINAKTLQYYKSGVLASENRDCDRSQNSINHATTIVGYTPTFWIVRNSWGTGWGENGYYRVKRGENICGIDHFFFGCNMH